MSPALRYYQRSSTGYSEVLLHIVGPIDNDELQRVTGLSGNPRRSRYNDTADVESQIGTHLISDGSESIGNGYTSPEAFQRWEKHHYAMAACVLLALHIVRFIYDLSPAGAA